MKAIIFAGSKNTRRLSFTAPLPIPLFSVGDWTVLEVLLMQLRAAGITDITIAINHLAHLIMSFCGDGSKWGLKINYSMEEKQLDSVTPIKRAQDLPETFFVINGNILTDLNFLDLYSYHQINESDITVALCERQVKIDFGVINIDAAGRIVEFQERPVYNFSVSMGIYVMNRQMFDIVPNSIPFGFNDLITACIEKKCKAICYRHEGYWLDISRPDDYARSQKEIDDFIKRVLPEYSAKDS